MSVAVAPAVGDVVWCHVKGEGHWPAQVFDESLASAKMKKARRPGTIMLAFFGDDSYGWYAPAALEAFEPNVARRIKEKTRYTKRVRLVPRRGSPPTQVRVFLRLFAPMAARQATTVSPAWRCNTCWHWFMLALRERTMTDRRQEHTATVSCNDMLQGELLPQRRLQL